MTGTLFDRFLWALLYFLILFSPLALAAYLPRPLFIIQLVSWVGSLSCFARRFFTDRRLSCWRTPFHLAVAIFMALILCQIFLPKGFIPHLEPSVYLRSSWESFFKLLTYVAAYGWVLSLVKTQRDITSLTRAIFVVAFVESLVGVLQSLSRAERVFWLYEVIVDDRPFRTFFSTFVNPNHFASFMGIAVFLLLGRFLYLNARYALTGDSRHLEERMVLLFVLAIGSVALFMSLSRGGSVIFTLTLLLFYQWILGSKQKQRSSVVLGLFVASTCLMLWWIGVEPILAELSTLLKPAEDVSLASRLVVWKASFFGLFAPHAWIGTGLGTFRYVFRSVQPADEPGFWAHAHSDWLELLIETGAVGWLVVFLALYLFLREIWPLRLNASDPYIRYNGAGAIGAFVYILAMSLYDFPLKMPACSVYLAILAAIAMKLRQFHDESAGVNRLITLTLTGGPKRVAVGAAALFFFVFYVAGITRPYWAHEMTKGLRRKSLAQLEGAIALDPLHADYHHWMAEFWAREAFFDGTFYNREKMRKALDGMEKAISLNPYSGKYSYGRAALAYRMGDLKTAEHYLEKTLEQEPSNPSYHIYYAIYCFNQVMAEHVLYGTDVTELPLFQKGLKSYHQAQAILPGVSLAPFREHVAAYDQLNKILHDKGLLPPSALL